MAVKLKEMISELQKKAVYVFCVVADNAHSFQKAAQSLENGQTAEEVSEDSDTEEVEILEGEEDVWVPVLQAMEMLSSEGIFCVRCGAHSLQLVCSIFEGGGICDCFKIYRFSNILRS